MPPDPAGPEAQTRWARVRALVEAALDVPATEQRAMLAGLERDPELVEEALGLLGAGEGPDPPPMPAVAGMWDGPRSEEDEEAPARLGPYRVLQRIGAGGMGTVHLALRDDGEFAKRVAVKIVKRGMDTEEVLRRFEQERQVLASLDHPGIARVLDGGRCPDGRPYLVMELVEGLPIDQWCDHERLGVRERIELFIQVCDAVADAHRSLVVHRDIKPSNVLVTRDGRPKLLDFGIAKVLDARQGFATIDWTISPLKLLTPAYASPEQVRGDPVTTASDVYSLGVVLYLLLTGRTPLRFETGSPAEIERVVCRVEPERPSTSLITTARRVGVAPEARDAATGDQTRELATLRSTTPKSLRRALSGDLDTIVLEALRKEPRRRYASAAELAADLRRHLRGLPVLARPDSLAYRSSRFVRRNRLAVAAAALVLGSLVGGLALARTQYARAERARLALAEQLEIDRARALELERLAEDLGEQRALAVDARSEAERRLAEVERLNEELEHQRGLALQRLADVRSFATDLAFRVHGELVPIENTEKARALVVGLGLGFLDRLSRDVGDDPSFQRLLVGSHLRMVEVQLQEPGPQDERQRAALVSAERAVALGEALHATDSASIPNRFALASACFHQGRLLSWLGRRAEAREALERARELGEADGGALQTHNGLAIYLGSALGELAALLADSGDVSGALERVDEAIRQMEALAERMPSTAETLAGLVRQRAQLLAARGELEHSVAELERAAELLAELLRSDPTHHIRRQNLRAMNEELAALLPRVGRDGDALELVESLLDSAEQRLATEGRGRGTLVDQFTALRLRADLLGRARRWDEAHGAARVLLAVARELRDLDPSGFGARGDLGLTLARTAEAALAVGALEDASHAIHEAQRLFEGLRREESESPRVRQGLLVIHALRAEVAETLAGAADGPARRDQWRNALAAWNEAEDLMRFHAPVDRWGAPDPSFARRVAEGRQRCAAALSDSEAKER